MTLTPRAMEQKSSALAQRHLARYLIPCTLLIMSACATTAPPRQVQTLRPQPPVTAPPPTAEALVESSAPNPASRTAARLSSMRAAVTSEAKEGADIVAGATRKGFDTVKSGTGVVIHGAEKVISLAHIKPGKTSCYPYDVCARPGQFSSCGFCWPTYGTVSRGCERGHKGLDVLAPTGTPVYAAKSGTVLYAGNKLSGYGNVVVIDHGAKVASIYGHNSKLLVKSGDAVRAGQQIACVGQTGRATAPHCHFEVRENGTPVDPKALLP